MVCNDEERPEVRMGVWVEPDYSLEDGERYHMTDFVPFSVPDSLDELHGSPTAVFSLPVTVYWGPERGSFDMTRPADVVRAYTEIVGHAGIEMQRRLLNENLLIEYWPYLSLDRRRTRPAWEERFPVLAQASRKARGERPWEVADLT